MLSQRRIISHLQDVFVGGRRYGRIDAQAELIHLRKLVPVSTLECGSGKLDVPVFQPSSLLIGAARDMLEKLHPDLSGDHEAGVVQGVDSPQEKLDTIRRGIVVKTFDARERLYNLDPAGHQ